MERTADRATVGTGRSTRSPIETHRDIRALGQGATNTSVRDLSQGPATGPGVKFVELFRKRYGRAPRVLHIGNIANNAYLNAKFLNAAGYDCDVLCYDYYHLMGCPEWEDATFDGDIADQFRPDWKTVDLKGFERPHWFAQGPQVLAIDYLIARRTGSPALARRLWRQLGAANNTQRARHVGEQMRLRWFASFKRSLAAVRLWPNAPHRLWDKLARWAVQRGNLGWLVVACAAPFLMAGVLAIRRLSPRSPLPVGQSTAPHTTPTELFAEIFPDRPDKLTATDLGPYSVLLDKWTELFALYDIVQAYATDVMYPLLANKRPYIGFEHGTLRDFTLRDDPICRLTALGYQQADHVFITNGDCLEYAQRINVQAFTPMIHPVDDRRIRDVQPDAAGYRRQFGAKYLFVCPLRHDWAIKGTDIYIRALPGIAARIGRDCRLVMTRWGAQLEDSIALAKELEVDDLIAWVEPLNRGKLVALQKSADVVFDQIALPHFGATAPQAIAAGVPVIMSYDPRSTAWIIPEAAPILPAWSPEEVVDAVVTALDPEWRAQYTSRASRWFDTYHSSAEAVRRLSETYYTVCLNSGLLEEE